METDFCSNIPVKMLSGSGNALLPSTQDVTINYYNISIKD